MTDRQQPVAVIGATGRQGSTVVDSLLEQRQVVRALVRDPQSVAALGLKARGVVVVAADQEDSESLQEDLNGVAALFS